MRKRGPATRFSSRLRSSFTRRILRSSTTTEPEKPPLRCYYDYSVLISLSDNHEVMAHCDCAITDWSVCLIVLVETLRHERMRTFTYLQVQEMWANKYPLPPNLIENRSCRIGRSKNQSNTRDLNTIRFSILRSRIFSSSLSSFSLRNLFGSRCLKYRWILSSSSLLA